MFVRVRGSSDGGSSELAMGFWLVFDRASYLVVEEIKVSIVDLGVLRVSRGDQS